MLKWTPNPERNAVGRPQDRWTATYGNNTYTIIRFNGFFVLYVQDENTRSTEHQVSDYLGETSRVEFAMAVAEKHLGLSKPTFLQRLNRRWQGMKKAWIENARAQENMNANIHWDW